MSNVPLTEGSLIGPYRVIREIGRGAQGIVYLADDSRLNRQVALKTLTLDVRGDSTVVGDFLADLREEAEITARLDHPGICTIFEADAVDRTAYIAMRYVRGHPLASETAGALPRTWSAICRVLGIVEQVARALHAAHEAGVVHRDIKPANIMIGSNGAPVILDFGLARSVAESGVLPAGGAFEGTIPYMSPEQLAPERLELDRRSDIYSLGSTLYECLTRRRPFTGESRSDLYRAIMTRDPPDPRRINRGLTFEIGAVLAKALAKDPDRRYQSAAAFAEDLARIPRFEIIEAAPTPLRLRVLRWTQRRPMALPAAGLVMLVLAGLLGVTTLLAREGRLRRAMRQLQARKLLVHAHDAISREPGLAARLLLEAEALEPNLPDLARVAADVVMGARGRCFLVGHEGAVVDGSFSHDGDKIVTGSLDGTARVWDARTGAPVERLGPVPQNERIAAVGWRMGKPVWVTSASDGVHVHSSRGTLALDGLPGQALTIALSPDGESVGVGCAEGTAAIWDTTDGRKLPRASPGTGSAARRSEPILDVRFSSEGTTLLSIAASNEGDDSRPASRSSVVGLRQVDQPENAITFGGLSGAPRKAAMSQKELAVAEQLDARTNRILVRDSSEPFGYRRDLGTQEGQVSRLCFSHNGEFLLTASEDKTVTLWSLGSKDARWAVLEHSSPVLSACFSPADDRILTTERDGRAIVWDVADLDLMPLEGMVPMVSDRDAKRMMAVPPTRSFGGYAPSAHVAPDGSVALFTFGEHPTFYETAMRRQIATLEHAKSLELAIHDAEFTADGEFCATLSADETTLTVWRSANGARIVSIPIKEGDDPPDPPQTRMSRRIAISFSPTGHRLLVRRRGDLRLCDLDSSAPSVVTVAPFDEEVIDARFSPNAEQVATASRRKPVCLWPLSSGKTPLTLGGGKAEAAAAILCFSPDGARIATTSDNHAVSVWDCATGRLVSQLNGHSNEVLRAEFDRNGKIVTASYDGTACVWDSSSGGQLSRFDCPEGTFVGFTGGGANLVTVSPKRLALLRPATGVAILSIPIQTSGFGLTRDGRSIVLEMSTCTTSFLRFPLDPIHEAHALRCRQLTAEERAHYDLAVER